jgi:hypothetical protein
MQTQTWSPTPKQARSTNGGANLQSFLTEMEEEETQRNGMRNEWKFWTFILLLFITNSRTVISVQQ